MGYCVVLFGNILGNTLRTWGGAHVGTFTPQLESELEQGQGFLNETRLMGPINPEPVWNKLGPTNPEPVWNQLGPVLQP